MLKARTEMTLRFIESLALSVAFIYGAFEVSNIFIVMTELGFAYGLIALYYFVKICRANEGKYDEH